MTIQTGTLSWVHDPYQINGFLGSIHRFIQWGTNSNHITASTMLKQQAVFRDAGTVGSNDPPEIYLGVKHGILTPPQIFWERNIFCNIPTRCY